MTAEVIALPGVTLPEERPSARDEVLTYLKGLVELIETGRVDPTGLVVIFPAMDGNTYMQRVNLNIIENLGLLALMQTRAVL